MKRYAAVKDDNGIFLTKDAQLDEAIENGCVILEIEEGQPEKVIATPTAGFLEPRPVLEQPETMSISLAAFRLRKGE